MLVTGDMGQLYLDEVVWRISFSWLDHIRTSLPEVSFSFFQALMLIAKIFILSSFVKYSGHYTCVVEFKL